MRKYSFFSQTWFGNYSNDMLLSFLATIVWGGIMMSNGLYLANKNLALISTLSYLIMARGLLLIGWNFKLKGIRRGARLLIFVGLYRLLLGYENNSIISDFSEVFEIYAYFVLLIDFLPLKVHFNNELISCLIIFKIGSLFLDKLGWIPSEYIQYFGAIHCFLLAFVMFQLSSIKVNEYEN
jgi:hypothetical protein